MEIIRIILAFLAGYSACIIVLARRFRTKPDGYFIVNQKNPEKDLVRLELRHDLMNLIIQRFVILVVKDENDN